MLKVIGIATGLVIAAFAVLSAAPASAATVLECDADGAYDRVVYMTPGVPYEEPNDNLTTKVYGTDGNDLIIFTGDGGDCAITAGAGATFGQTDTVKFHNLSKSATMFYGSGSGTQSGGPYALSYYRNQDTGIVFQTSAREQVCFYFWGRLFCGYR